MGLDMYIYKAPKVKEFATFEDMRKALEIYEKLKRYEDSLYLLNNPEKYISNDFWSLLGENEEDKRIRIFEELKKFVKISEEFYQENKQRFTDKQFEEMKKYYDSEVEVAYWRKFYKLNDYILENFVPEELQGMDMNCVPFELTKDNIINIMDTVKDHEITEDKNEIEYTVEQLTSLLNGVNFEHEMLLYHEWY